MIDLTSVALPLPLIGEFDVLVALSVAAVLGMLLGLERSIAGKQAGMRTYALVSLGSSLFTICGTLASYELASFSGINPLQIAGSIVIGIGFIGAGLSTLRGEHAELTTAAGIWLAAGIGMAAGLGLYLLAAGATVLGLIIFSLFLKVENAVRRKYETSAEQ